jgi:AcrR family transcriptional regulator
LEKTDLSADRGPAATAGSNGSATKTPRTARGERTRRKILDAALEEFGELGFREASIVGITRRARVALGTFYTYFDSKEALFSALVRDMSAQVGNAVAPALSGSSDLFEGERRALAAFLRFAATHKQVYRIVDEAEFVDAQGFRQHYEEIAARIQSRLAAGERRGELGKELPPSTREIIAWAMMGANVFLGLRYSVWDDRDPEEVATVASKLFKDGLTAKE